MAQLSLDTAGPPGTESRIDPDMWDAAVPPISGHQVIVGGPGTGKTEFLCRRAAAAITAGMRPEEILMLGFSRVGTRRIRSRLVDLTGPKGHRVVVTTYPALAMQIVEGASTDLGWASPPNVLTALEQERLVADLLTTEDPSIWSPAYRPVLTSEAMASEVTDFLLRAREHRLSADAVAAADRDQWKGLPEFMRRYDATLLERNRIDYGSALDAATSLTERRSEVVDHIAIVLADEYQDTSPVQADLLFSFAASGASLTVAADPYQSIYSFRGTDIGNVYDFPDRCEEKLESRAERIILTTSFRVPTEILEASVAVTARELPGGAGKVLSTRIGGSVACHEFTTSGEEAEWIARDIERLHLVEQVPVDRFAIFVRSHSSLVDEIARSLDRRGIPHAYTDDRLVDQPIIRFLHDLVSATVDLPRNEDEEGPATLRRVLAGPFVGIPPAVAASLPHDRSEWIPWMVSLDAGLDQLASLLSDSAWCTAMSANQGMWHVWSTLPSLESVAIATDRGPDRLAWSAYAQMLDRAAVRSPGSTLVDAALAAAEHDFEADSLFDANAQVGVSIATMHRAKGTEFDVVYIADASDGVIPDLRVTDSMLGVRHLNPHLPSDAGSYVTFRLDEERRLAYTAMTRSSSRVVWTATTASDSADGRPPSRFMGLVAPTTPTVAADETPVTPRALLAEVRRTLSDPDAAPFERIGAMLFLADTSNHGVEPLDRYGTRERGSDFGLLPGKLRLSPSQAMSYDECPRRYAAERFLLTVDEETVYLRLGTLIHAVVEATEVGATSEGRERGSLDEALLHLDTLWDESGFGEDIVGQSWRNRAEEILTNLYTLWPTSAVPVAHEVDLRLEIDGIPWLGRADRIERVDDTISLVDYKTGQAVSVSEAESSLQLGYYALAAGSDGDVTALGTVADAQFWYPAKPLKSSITTRSFDIDNLDDVEARLVEIGRAIRTEDFSPVPSSACQRCSVVGSCPAVAAGGEAFQP